MFGYLLQTRVLPMHMTAQVLTTVVCLSLSLPLFSQQPTSVTSLQDLSNGIPSLQSSELDADPAAIKRPQARAATASHSMVMLGGLGDASTSSLSSTESGDLKPKQSATSPVHSKRSHSAGYRISPGGSKRVLSAGDERGKARKTIDSQEVAPRRQSKQQKALEKQVHVSHKGTKDKISQQKSSSRVKKSDTFPFWDTEVAPFLAELDAATLATDVTDLYRVCDSLWGSLERHDLLGRSGGMGGSKRRAATLRSVFRLLDRKDPHLLLKLAKIILAVSPKPSSTGLVTGSLVCFIFLSSVDEGHWEEPAERL